MGKFKTAISALKKLFTCCYKTVDIVDNLTSEDHRASGQEPKSKIVVIDEKNNNHKELVFDHPVSLSIHGNINIINSSLDNFGMHQAERPLLTGESSDSLEEVSL